jgi:DNA polymerase-3 subunit delta
VIGLHRVSLAVSEGTSLDQALWQMRPPPHFSRKPLIETALRLWPQERLLTLMGQLANAVLETRKHAALAETLAHRALMGIATGARKKV